MEIRIESPHFTPDESLNTSIMEKVGKLEHLGERLIRSDVCLKLDKSDKDDNKICEIKVLGPGKSLFAKKRALTFDDALTKTVHAIEEQLRRKKTKLEKVKEKLEPKEIEEQENEES